MENTEYIEICKKWGIGFKCVRNDIVLFGSPERTEFRVSVEDKNGGIFIIEEIAKNRLSKKQTIAEVLGELKKKNPKLNICAYLENNDSQYIANINGRYWQIVPYIKGVKINRSTYMDDEWRAVIMADFLISLRNASDHISENSLKNMETFSLNAYVKEIKDKIKFNDHDVFEKIKNIVSKLENTFFEKYEMMPTAFCHGDYHPLNIIWSSNSIASVIDWEFCGQKIELYDVANMIGCLGMENPETLKKEIVLGFIARLKKSGIFQDVSWENLVDLIIANRFAWLSEWLRYEDTDMIQMEIDYMNLLSDNKKLLEEIWHL